MKQVSTIFLDRDGVINDVVMRGSTVGSPRSLAEFNVRADFEEFHRKLSRFRLNLFVVSNQPDVSRGLLDRCILDSMTTALARFDFRQVVYCVHDDSHGCECRKPKAGMINRLLNEFRLERSHALMIGDSSKDVLAGKAANVPTVLIRRPYNMKADCSPDLIVDDIRELIDLFAWSVSAP